MSTAKKDPLYLSKAELKRMQAREFNRQYEEQKANPKASKEVVREALNVAVDGFRKGLGI